MSTKLNFECSQIESLEDILPRLLGVPLLKKLSLHGNRLRTLPTNLSMLSSLEFLDISANLFASPNENLIKSLKTLPSLKELHITISNKNEQKLIIQELPNLVTLNGKPVSHFQEKESSEEIKQVASDKVSPFQFFGSDTGNVSPMDQHFSQKLAAFQQTETSNRKENPLKFNKEISKHEIESFLDIYNNLLKIKEFFKPKSDLNYETVLSEHLFNTLEALKIKCSEIAYPISKEVHLLKAKFDLSQIVFELYIEMMENSVSMNFTECNLGLIRSLKNKLIDIFGRFSELATFNQSKNESKISKAKEKLKILVCDQSSTVQKLEKSLKFNLEVLDDWDFDLKHFENDKLELQEELETLRKENKMLLSKLLYETNQRVLESNRRMTQVDSEKTDFISKQMNLEAYSGKDLTTNHGNKRSKTIEQQLNCLRESVEEIVNAKWSHEKNSTSKDTMENFMFAYLKKKYGLQSLITHHAQEIIVGIKELKNYSVDVFLFGKILRNEINEEYWKTNRSFRTFLREILRNSIQKRNPYFLKNQIDSIVAGIFNGDDLLSEDWKEIVQTAFSGKSKQIAKFCNELNSAKPEKFSDLEEKICLFKAMKYETDLKEFTIIFRGFDEKKGHLNREKLKQLVEVFNVEIKPSKTALNFDKMFACFDSQSAGKITYSQIICVLSEPTVEFGGKRVSHLQILNHLAKSRRLSE